MVFFVRLNAPLRPLPMLLYGGVALYYDVVAVVSRLRTEKPRSGNGGVNRSQGAATEAAVFLADVLSAKRERRIRHTLYNCQSTN